MIDIVIEIIRDAAGFRALRGEWTALLRNSTADTLFLTWEWLYSWWKHLGGESKLSIIALRSNGELIALAPFALRPPRISRMVPFRSLGFLGTGFVGSDYLDVIVRRGKEPEALNSLAEYLSGQGYMLELGQLSSENSFARQLAVGLAARGWTSRGTNVNVCPFIDLAGHSWPTYLASLGSSHRYNFNRRLKNLSKEFEVRFDCAGNEEQRSRSLDILIELHNQRWTGRGGSDAFHQHGLIAFHQEFSRVAMDRGWLRLYVLWLGGRPAAAIYGFRYGETSYFYQSGLDPAFARFSVGLVSMGLAIKTAIEEGAGEYDLLHGAEEYKSHWARQTRALERLEFYPPRLRGLICRQMVGLSRTSRRVARQMLPEFVANRIAAAKIGI